MTVKKLVLNFLQFFKNYFRSEIKRRYHHLWNYYGNRHFSHETRSRIFENFNLREKADHNFCWKILKNHFPEKWLQAPKIIFKSPKLLASAGFDIATFWKTKDWSSHFWEGQPFRFWYVECTIKEDLNRQRQVFLLNFRPWLTEKPKIWSIFYGK